MRLISLGLATLLTAWFAVSTHAAVPPAYQWTAQKADVPSIILFAVALQESGMPLHGRLIPWPWTLNIAGTPQRYVNRSDACLGLRQALLQVPATRIDVGLCQLNVGYHGNQVGHVCDLLDPYHNLDSAATILRQHFDHTHDWLDAAARYHYPAGGAPARQYRLAVEQHLRRVLGAGFLSPGVAR